MELSRTVAVNVFIMFALMCFGVIAVKARLISKNSTGDFTKLLLYMVSPSVIVVAFCRDFDPRMAKMMAIATAASVFLYIVGILLAMVAFKKVPDRSHSVPRYAAVFPNSGFMGIPLLQAVLGADGVMLAMPFVFAYNAFTWTTGVYMMSGDKKSISLKKIFLNPNILAMIAGLALFILPVQLHENIQAPINFLAQVNTPLAMILLGTYLVGLDFKKAFKTKEIYISCAIKLAIMPMLALLLCKACRLDQLLTQAIVISMACPSAAATSMLAAMYDLDTGFGAMLTSVSTILCLLTIPLISMLV